MLLKAHEIHGLATDLKQDYAKRDKRIDTIRQTMRMENELVDSRGHTLIPDQYQLTAIEVHLPLVRDVFQRIVSSLTANYPSITVPPWSSSPGAVAASGKREKALNLGLQRLEEEAGRPVFSRIVASQVLTGWGVHEFLYQPHHWKGFPRQGGMKPDEYEENVKNFQMGRRLPYAWRHIQTDSFFPIMSDGKIQRTFVIKKVPVWDAADEFSVAVDSLKKLGSKAIVGTNRSDMADTVQITEHWDSEHVQYMAGEGSELDVIYEVKHGYGRVPFFVAWGDQGDDDDPTFMSESPLWPVAVLQPLVEALMTIQTNVAYLTGFPTWQLTTPPEVQGIVSLDEHGTFEMKTGEIHILQPGQEIKPLFQQLNTGQIDAMVNFIMSMIDRSSLPAMARGQGIGSDFSGYLVNQVMSAIRGRLSGLVISCQKSLSEMVEFWQWLVENKQKLPMIIDTGPQGNDVTLAPKDIRRYYRANARLDAEFPTNIAIDADVAMKLNSSGLWSKRRAMESVKVTDTSEERLEIATDKLLETPEAMALIMQIAGKEVMEELQAEAGAEQGVPPGGAPIAPGTPFTPNGLPPLNPEQMQAEVMQNQGPSGMGGRPEGAERLPGGVPGGAPVSLGVGGPQP